MAGFRQLFRLHCFEIRSFCSSFRLHRNSKADGHGTVFEVELPLVKP